MSTGGTSGTPLPLATRREVLERERTSLRGKLRPPTPVWVSWPKKPAKAPTDITEDTMREVALPLGYVDVKVCAMDDV